ncbi:MAG TPA: TetR family transcriptional regulator [Acidimicrobiales bacterium]
MLAITQVGAGVPTAGAVGASSGGSVDNGLRSRKKERTRLAIADAALELFVEKGYEATTVEEIAERAEVSKATFFRYFATKGEVIYHWNADHHGSLHAAIVSRPVDEDDMLVLRRGLVQWVATLDTARMLRQGQAASSSPLLRGMSYDLGATWQAVVAGALAERHGLEPTDQRCRLMAGVAFAVMSSGFNAWVAEGATGDYPLAIDHAFDLLDPMAVTPATS